MAITVVFDPPLPTDPPATFDSKAFTLLGDLNTFATEANALQTDVNVKEGTASAAAATATTKAAEVAADRIAVQTAAADALAARDLTLTYRDDAQAAAAAAATFDPANYVPRAGGVALSGPISVPAGASGSQVPQAQEVAMLATTQLGFRNKVINGNFTVNQDAVSGTVVLAAGAYGHDQWKAGSSGCTYTFATSAGVTTLTITAGSLIQPLEGVDLQTDTYTLSWVGTAQGKVGAGGYGASGQTAAVTGGVDLNLEFGTGTLSLVQFELGETPTPFEHRPLTFEALLCYRHYVVLSPDEVNKLGAIGRKYSNNQDYLNVAVQWPTRMRVSPTLVETGARVNENINTFYLYANQVGFINVIGALTANSIRAYNFGIRASARM